MTDENKMLKVIVCSGKRGTAVIYGHVKDEPVTGEPVRLMNARMIIHWTGKRGLFGVAASGPDPESNITEAVDGTGISCCKEWLLVSDKAAAILDVWGD